MAHQDKPESLTSTAAGLVGRILFWFTFDKCDTKCHKQLVAVTLSSAASGYRTWMNEYTASDNSVAPLKVNCDICINLNMYTYILQSIIKGEVVKFEPITISNFTIRALGEEKFA